MAKRRIEEFGGKLKMKCNNDKKCVCLTCKNMKDCYCSYFKSNHMCDKCDWKGYVTHCPNKKQRGESI